MAATTKEGHRKSPIAIKRADGEPINRSDLQYELLQCVFDDQHAAFTDPFQSASPPRKVTFRALYLSALINSPKSPKVLRDRLMDPKMPNYANDFAMLALLTNVGRINTTMAFFPEMRTPSRIYHPIPAFKRHDGSLQDAPRIKTTLKSCLMGDESKTTPTTPTEVLTRRLAHQVPSTSIVNLVFVMSNHSFAVAKAHIEDTEDFLNLFRACHITSADRARVFLWLCFHYLESPSDPNPYADAHALENPGQSPRMTQLDGEPPNENVDPEDEIEWGKKMQNKRKMFVDKWRSDAEKPAGTPLPTNDDDSVGTGTAQSVKEGSLAPTPSVSKVKGKSRRKNDAADQMTDPPVEVPTRGRPSRETALANITTQESYVHEPVPTPPVQPSAARSKPSRPHKVGQREVSMQYPPEYAPPSPERTMFQHAWHIITTTDPLVDSDEEMGDHHARLDYVRRLDTLKRLRGKSPTPEPVSSGAMEVDSSVW